MSRLDEPMGGFGGPRIVRPQANVYTVLLLVACLFAGAALAVVMLRYQKLKNPPLTPKVGAVIAPAGAERLVPA